MQNIDLGPLFGAVDLHGQIPDMVKIEISLEETCRISTFTLHEMGESEGTTHDGPSDPCFKMIDLYF